jgi:hypothetical protein
MVSSIMAERVWQAEHHGGQEAENGNTGRSQRKTQHQGPTPNELVTQPRSHFLKFPKPPKLTPPIRDQGFNICACGRHFIFKPSIPSIFLSSLSYNKGNFCPLWYIDL